MVPNASNVMLPVLNAPGPLLINASNALQENTYSMIIHVSLPAPRPWFPPQLARLALALSLVEPQDFIFQMEPALPPALPHSLQSPLMGSNIAISLAQDPISIILTALARLLVALLLPKSSKAWKVIVNLLVQAMKFISPIVLVDPLAPPLSLQLPRMGSNIATFLALIGSGTGIPTASPLVILLW